MSAPALIAPTTHCVCLGMTCTCKKCTFEEEDAACDAQIPAYSNATAKRLLRIHLGRRDLWRHSHIMPFTEHARPMVPAQTLGAGLAVKALSASIK